MSGVSDAPFRKIAHDNGAGLVISEMVASEELVRARPDMLRRAVGADQLKPFAIQLAGREPRWMGEGARVAADLGADIIDINMGCPARQVTGGWSGSALMREPDLALSLIEATVAASPVPVTLKMRLGWDDTSLNAAAIAQRAEQAGIQMITVHGRTRCQFYKGRANWRAIREVVNAVSVPVVANGDAESAGDVGTMLQESNAAAVMIGRAAYGRPWLPGVLAQKLEAGTGCEEPGIEREAELFSLHHQSILSLYGHEHGNRIARKHIGWTISRLAGRGFVTIESANNHRRMLLSANDNAVVSKGLKALFAEACSMGNAA
jgi:nifR3 family TIM-barrel protein